MNHLLLFNEDVAEENVALVKGRRFLHMRDVLGNSCGETIKIGLCNSKMGIGIITSMDESSARIEFALEDDPPPKIPVTLVLALCRPKSLKRALFYAVSMGVREIHIIRSYRVDKSYFSSPVLGEESIREIALLALEQCRDTVLPEVKIHRLFKPFVQDDLPAISSGKRKILCHPYSDKNVPASVKNESVAVIGPDGGFIQYEIDMFNEYGFESLSLGGRILRTENAVAAFLSKFM